MMIWRGIDYIPYNIAQPYFDIKKTKTMLECIWCDLILNPD